MPMLSKNDFPEIALNMQKQWHKTSIQTDQFSEEGGSQIVCSIGTTQLSLSY